VPMVAPFHQVNRSERIPIAILNRFNRRGLWRKLER
jgi:hypothetical protein